MNVAFSFNIRQELAASDYILVFFPLRILETYTSYNFGGIRNVCFLTHDIFDNVDFQYFYKQEFLMKRKSIHLGVYSMLITNHVLP